MQVVGWASSRGLPSIINSHHDDWADDPTTFSENLPRFLAIWSQVAAFFASANSSLLHFEVFNEPVNLRIEQLNTMYAAVVPLMRKGGLNPTRLIYIGGLSFMNPTWILANPDALVFPALASGARDPNLALEIHSYDPFKFCLQARNATLCLPTLERVV